jgi:uncharacterized membrane protein
MRWFLSMSRFAQVLLVLSLAVNIFFLSALAMRFAPQLAQTDAAADPTIRRFIDRLPPQDAALMREVLQKKRPQLAAARANYRQALAQVNTLLALETLDQAALQSALTRAGQARQAVINLRVEIYSEALPRLSKEGRTLAARLD